MMPVGCWLRSRVGYQPEGEGQPAEMLQEAEVACQGGALGAGMEASDTMSPEHHTSCHQGCHRGRYTENKSVYRLFTKFGIFGSKGGCFAICPKLFKTWQKRGKSKFSGGSHACHHVTMSPGHQDTMSLSPCHHGINAPCHHDTMSLETR